MERNFDKTNITLRLKSAEAVRYYRLLDEAKSRSPFCDKSDIIRELIGLEPPHYLTSEEIEYFRTGRK